MSPAGQSVVELQVLESRPEPLQQPLTVSQLIMVRQGTIPFETTRSRGPGLHIREMKQDWKNLAKKEAAYSPSPSQELQASSYFPRRLQDPDTSLGRQKGVLQATKHAGGLQGLRRMI
mmetsp:Transcript_54176/g.110533  ORF Transcript_54176/g.110533 Transcript_54176/m.110533 type:complete len:118 (+) Transcript_54176:177-530(+)